MQCISIYVYQYTAKATCPFLLFYIGKICFHLWLSLRGRLQYVISLFWIYQYLAYRQVTVMLLM